MIMEGGLRSVLLVLPVLGLDGTSSEVLLSVCNREK